MTVSVSVSWFGLLDEAQHGVVDLIDDIDEARRRTEGHQFGKC